MKKFDVIVIGAGQAGLAAGYYLKQQGLNFLILERDKIGGSWGDYYDSLELFTPAKYSSLPGLSFPGEQSRYPTRLEMSEYLKQYARHFSLPVKEGALVQEVVKKGGDFLVATSQGEYIAKSVIVAIGPFNEPFTPNIPGQGQFKGRIIHSHEYKNTEPFKGKRVVVVGRGASAVQIAVELGGVADTTLALRKSVRFLPRQILGKDITFWSKYTIDLFKAPMKGSAVIDTEDKKYERALRSGTPEQKRMFSEFYEDGVIWETGSREPVDVVIFATGYKPTFSFLQDGRNTKLEGLFFLGMPNMRNYASATVRGAGRDAKIIIKRVAQFLKHGTVAAAR